MKLTPQFVEHGTCIKTPSFKLSKLLLDGRHEIPFCEETIGALLEAYGASHIVSELILSGIPHSIETVNAKHFGDALLSWNLFDCFDALVTCQFAAKACIEDARTIGRISADLIAQLIENDEERCHLERLNMSGFSLGLQCHMDQADCELVTSLWVAMICTLAETKAAMKF